MRRGQFDDVTAQFGLLQPTFGYTGFGAQWFDYDNDGWLDLFIANGGVTIGGSERGGASPYAQRKQLFHNEGRGKRFHETSPVGRRRRFRWRKSAAAPHSATSITTARSTS